MSEIMAPFQKHSDTSRDAAQSIESVVLPLREKVLRAIRSSPAGMTAQEISTATGIVGDTVRPRIVELVRDNKIHVAGKRRTKSGRNADVWFAKW